VIRSLQAVLTCLLIVQFVPQATAQGQQNVLIILADDMGVEAVGAYGEGMSPPPTPNIDALASTGVLFRNAWSNPNCSPSRAVLLTGRYSFRNTVGTILGGGNMGLPTSEITIPEMLALDPGLGYSTACLGKWHLGDHSNGGPLAPNVAGFDHYSGSYSGMFVAAGVPWQQAYFQWNKLTNGVLQRSTTYNTTETVDDALAWIASVAEDGPWLTYVSFCAPHEPFHAPPRNLHSIDLPMDGPEVDPRPYFEAMVQSMDTEIGRLIAGLGTESENTTILFIGDNGTSQYVIEPPYEPTQSKGSPYEGGVNVPIIISGPVTEAVAGSECAALVGLVDVFATVAEIAGVDLNAVLPSDHTLDSVSMVPYLFDPTTPSLRPWIFTELFAPNGTRPVVSDRAIRDSRYKLIRSLNGKGQLKERLFDLQKDPYEQVNLLRKYVNPKPTFLKDIYWPLSDQMDALLASP
jgi:arylsulfatase B